MQEHLLAIRAEAGDLSRAELVARLGEPSRYAADLLSAAGLEVHPPRRPLVDADRVARVAAAGRGYVRRLEPAWWAVRGFLIAGLIVPATEHIQGDGRLGSILFLRWRPDIVERTAGVDGKLWLIVPIVLGVVFSIAVGLRAEARGTGHRLPNRVLDLAGVAGLALVPMWWIGPAFYFYVLQGGV